MAKRYPRPTKGTGEGRYYLPEIGDVFICTDKSYDIFNKEVTVKKIEVDDEYDDDSVRVTFDIKSKDTHRWCLFLSEFKFVRAGQEPITPAEAKKAAKFPSHLVLKEFLGL